MTNTLHRFGDAESFRDDYIVFAMCSRGKNDEDSVPSIQNGQGEYENPSTGALFFRRMTVADQSPRA